MWYYRRASDVLGPITWEELQQKADQGEITPETPVRQGSEGAWRSAAEVEGLWLTPTGSIEGLAEDDEQVQPGPAAEGAQVAPVSAEAAPRARSPLSLRPCSDCGTMVSQHASMCPHCGRSFHALSLSVPYRGEHPVPVWVFFTLLAVAFMLASPVVIHRGIARVAAESLKDELAAQAIAVAVAVVYAVSMVCCAVLGGAVGAPRMAYYTGLLLGLFFGPLGVFAAFAIDKRPQCPNCCTRLGGLARECPACHAHLTWTMKVRWY